MIMPTTRPETTISVRGEARQVVAPDYAVLSIVIRVNDADKQVVLERAGSAQAAAVDAVRQLGGVALAIETIDAALTWSTRTFSAREEYRHDGASKRRIRIGWETWVPVRVTVRDLGLLADLMRALTAIEAVQVEDVHWDVDRRNPAWPTVRAAAIADAITKARDYATALNGSLTALVHVADAGLLGGPDHQQGRQIRGLGFSGSGQDAGSDMPDLDPAPQELTATIEARFAATVSPV